MKNKSALVTGANKGLGFEVVKLLAGSGVLVYLTARDLKKAELAYNTLGDCKKNVRLIELDVANTQSVSAAFEKINSEIDSLDMLINNAGINYDSWQKAINADIDGECMVTMETNFYGPWRMIKTFLPLLLKSAHGRIVNVSSEAGSIAALTGGIPAYATSKAALNALTKTVAGELKGNKILVNSVCPGWCATEMGGTGGRSPELGAKSILWAAELPDDGPSGGFFRDGKPLNW
jgi:NAD(P)-dependent dehydrogenase (short-subunit alcohol dehydrogenase family)